MDLSPRHQTLRPVRHLTHPPELVRLVGIFRPLQLHLQSLGANLKAVHGLNSALCFHWSVVANETEAFAEIGDLIDEDFGADDVAKRREHLNEVCV